MSSHVSFDSTHTSLLPVPTNAAHSTTLGPLTFSNYSPRRIQACLDSTMTYLQQQQGQQQEQQQQQPPLLPPQALVLQQQQLQQHQLLLQQHQQQKQQLLCNQQHKQQARYQQLAKNNPHSQQHKQQYKQAHPQHQQEQQQTFQQQAYQNSQIQKQHNQQQLQQLRSSSRSKDTHTSAYKANKESLLAQSIHPSTSDPKITFAPRNPRDQTREQEELILPKGGKGSQQTRYNSIHSQEIPLRVTIESTNSTNVSRLNNSPTTIHPDGNKDAVVRGGRRYNVNEDDKEDNGDDDSEYDEDSMDDEDDSELDDSDIDDDDYSDSESDHAETLSTTHMPSTSNQRALISNETMIPPTISNPNAMPARITPDQLSNNIHPLSAQRAHQEVVKQLTLATGAWSINPDTHSVQEPYRAKNSSTDSSSSKNSNNNHSMSSTNPSTHTREDGMGERVLMLENIKPQDRLVSTTTRRSSLRDHASALPPLPSTNKPITRLVQQQQYQQVQQQKPDHDTTSTRMPTSESSSSSGEAPHIAKARMLPYVEDDGGDEDEYSGEDEEEDEDEDEDDYSYSEDEDDEEEEDDEDEDSSSEYHYGIKENIANKTNKPRAPPPGQYTRSIYSHYRPPRLDENYLRKRAITKQVARRSSLTALLGEASQPAPPLNLQAKNFTIHPTGSPLGLQVHHNAQASRCPGLTSVWSENGAFFEPPSVQQHQDVRAELKGYCGSTDSGRTATIGFASRLESGSNLSEQNSRLILGPNATAILSQEPNRPHRTDSGVEVKISPTQHRVSSSSSSDSKSSNDQPSTRWVDTLALESSSSSSKSSNGQGSNHAPTITIIPARRPRMKSEGDASDIHISSSVAIRQDVLASNETTDVSQIVKRPLKSSISCHTLPRAAGKRVGRKHVSWHHSLFPSERVLRVKPSIPSLSNVAVESAEATLSQLPNIPVMARDNIKDYHQSIRSLRALSRDEITKMSYKQQGRQELTSTVPISKSAHDSTSWWNPSRWLKGSPTVDKRHWKPDSSRETCAYCFTPFNRLTNPRHHCRKCGDIFCGKCASAEILMDAKNCVYVQQSQLARWSRRVDIQRHNLWIDTLPQLHPVRTAVESALVAGAGVNGASMGTVEGTGSIGHASGINGSLNGVNVSQRSLNGVGNGSRRGSWQIAPSSTKKSRLSIFGLFGQGTPGTGSAYQSDSRRGSMDVSAAENVYANHYGHLQPHSLAFMGRRASSSSVLRSSNSVSGTGHMMIAGAPLTLNNEGAIAMSRRMSSGGVGEVCLARICVGCERELLKPISRCTSIAKYYGSLGARNGQKRQTFGYSSLGPHVGRQHQQQQHANPHQGPIHPMDNYSDQDLDSTVTGHHEYLTHGVRRHSPLRQTSVYSTNMEHSTGEGRLHQQQQKQQQHNSRSSNGGWSSRDDAVRSYGDSRYCPSELTFQEQQLYYAQQTNGPMPRELY